MLLDDEFECRRGVDVNDQRSPRRSDSMSAVLAPDVTRRSTWKSTRPESGRTFPASSSRSKGEAEGGIRVAATSPLLVTSMVSPFFTRSRILLLWLRSSRWGIVVMTASVAIVARLRLFRQECLRGSTAVYRG